VVQNRDNSSVDDYRRLSQDVEYLAGEVKLLAINLAIALAKSKQKGYSLVKLEPQFSELIQRVNRTSAQVVQVLEAFRNQKQMLFSLPASTEVIERRGAYDKTEATLNHVYDLSQGILKQIREINGQNKGGVENAGKT